MPIVSSYDRIVRWTPRDVNAGRSPEGFIAEIAERAEDVYFDRTSCRRSREQPALSERPE
jgi:hypothetical protein